ncbi:uncharacterized protein LOC128886511 [Hylaeus anthracinus]|uniref:uncharacterized protein LOC128886511 n=1 Tax=Hylaeus anthracinus TaxID=313031 RepID=UPI0023BA250C|nr:uncharacterized protein LOC128886511 [Hylaeus anthracinus]
MFGNVTPERAIEFTWYSVALNYCWPPPSTATRPRMVYFKIVRILAILSAFALVLPLLYSLHVHRNDPVIFTKAACLAASVSQIPMQSFFCIVHYDRLQALTEQMVDYCAKARSYERFVLQRYVNKYSTFYGVSATWFYLTATVVVVGSLFVDQPFPTEAEYPFPVNFMPLRTTLFIHQAFVGLQCAAIVCMNMFAALLLLFAAARFEILMLELRSVQDIGTLIQCIRKYYHVRKYAQEVVTFVQYTALSTTIVASVLLVLSGFHIVGVSLQPYCCSLLTALWKHEKTFLLHSDNRLQSKCNLYSWL